MRVPYGWLAELVDGLPPLDRVVELLDGLGLAVEEVHEQPAAPAGVVVAEVVAAARLVGSDHLSVAEVSDGRRSYRVVCGAPNVRVGLRTALALPGAELLSGDLIVGEREMLGVISEGVLCSPRELGLFDQAGGLIAFGDDAPLGASLQELWPAERVIEIEVTPNRADAFSLLGVARDLAVKLGSRYHHPALGLDPGDGTVDDGLTVRIEDPGGCPRFTLRRIDGVRLAPSPLWLQRRLAHLGLRPRNNVIDVTNYVTFELGQPAHAYDRAALVEGTIVVRRAQSGEGLVTLGDQQLELDPADLVIATPNGDGSVAIGLAGVIGGREDSVRMDTGSVALEVAHFHPVSVRKTAKRHQLSTDAHYRFERGVDPNLPLLASARAALLIADLAGGTIHPGHSQVGGDVERAAIAFRPSRVPFLMAFDVPLDTQQRYLEGLGCSVEPLGDDRWRVTPPSWRFDLAIEEDLVEEVGRLHGYENIAEHVPDMNFVPPQTDPTHRRLRLLLAGMGLQEVMTYVWSGDEALARARAPEAAVRLANPQGVESAVLRTALHPSLLGVAAVNRAAPSLALFEIGHVFGAEEREHLGLLLGGAWLRDSWRPGRTADFFVLKGLIAQLAASLGAPLALEPEGFPHLHPGVSARVLWNGEAIGSAGRLHPAVAADLELSELYLAELTLPLAEPQLSFRDIPRQPHAERDLAVIAPYSVPFGELERLVVANAGERLESIAPFDVYRGEQVGEGNRSIALRLRFRHPQRALTDEEVDRDMANVMVAVGAAGYHVRR